jgi:hypothetical protein
MSTKKRSVQTAFAGLLVVVILACNLPGSQSPQTLTTPGATLLIPPANTSTNSLVLDASPTLPLIALATPSNQPVITSTYTPLPPLPDFEEVLSFGGGGGDAPCLYIPDKSLPATEGGTAFGAYFLPRTAILCIWGAPFNVPLQVSMTSPSGQTTLRGSVQVESATDKVLWLGQNLRESSSLATRLDNTTAIFLSLWWPGSLESGVWNVDVQWSGGKISGTFTAETRIHPEVSVVDSRSSNMVLPGRCHTILDYQNIEAVGENFPSNSLAYILVYKSTGEYGDARLIGTQSAQADVSGYFATQLDQEFEPGLTYYVVGIWDPNAVISKAGGSVNYDVVADAIDCFSIATDTPSSCPGAPAQRITTNQRGYVCTKSDPVRLRNGPNRSASTLVQLAKGTQFTVIGGPSCADNWSWWQVRTDSGQTGWVSEGGDAVDPYFICPLP